MQRLLVIAFLFASLAVHGSELSDRRPSYAHNSHNTRYVDPSRLPHYNPSPSAFTSTRWAKRPGTTRSERNRVFAALAMAGNLINQLEQSQLNNTHRYN